MWCWLISNRTAGLRSGMSAVGGAMLTNQEVDDILHCDFSGYPSVRFLRHQFGLVDHTYLPPPPRGYYSFEALRLKRQQLQLLDEAARRDIVGTDGRADQAAHERRLDFVFELMCHYADVDPDAWRDDIHAALPPCPAAAVHRLTMRPHSSPLPILGAAAADYHDPSLPLSSFQQGSRGESLPAADDDVRSTGSVGERERLADVERYVCWRLRSWCSCQPGSRRKWWCSDPKECEELASLGTAAEGECETYCPRLRCSVCWRELELLCFPRRRRRPGQTQCKRCVKVWGRVWALARAKHHMVASWWWFLRLWWRAVVEARRVVAERRAVQQEEDSWFLQESWAEEAGLQEAVVDC